MRLKKRGAVGFIAHKTRFVRRSTFLRLVLILAAATTAAPKKQETVTIGIHFHVIHAKKSEQLSNNGAKIDRTFIEERIKITNAIYRPTKTRFEVAAIDRLRDQTLSAIKNRKERHALAPLVKPHVINCFIVDSLADVDIAGRVLRGVHWRSKKDGEKVHYVILSRIGKPRVLAHELGHFFGNAHTSTQDNVMSYNQTEKQPSVSQTQIRRIMRMRNRMLRSGELTER